MSFVCLRPNVVILPDDTGLSLKIVYPQRRNRRLHGKHADSTSVRYASRRGDRSAEQLMLDQIDLAKYPVGDHSFMKVDVVEVRNEVLMER